MIGFLSKIIKRINQDTYIYHKFIGLAICMVVVPLFLLTLIFYQMFQQIIENEIGTSYEQIVNQYVDSINYKLGIYQNLLDNIAVNALVQDIFSQQDKIKFSDTYEISKKFSKEIDNFLVSAKKAWEIRSIFLYALHDEFPSDGRYISNIKVAESEGWYKKLKKGLPFNCFFYTTEGLKQDVVALTRPIGALDGKNYDERIGLAKIDLYAAQVFDSGSSQSGENTRNIYIFDEEGNVIYNGSKVEFPYSMVKNFDEVLSREAGREVIKESGVKEILVYKRINNYGWKAVVLFPYNEVDKKVKDVGASILLTVLVMMVVIIALAIFLSKFFSRRMNLLVKKMKRIEKGDLEVTEVIEGKDEIGMMDTHFNQMMGKLNELIYENYIQKIEKREAELNALQMQINPHFLYNTLESISAIAAVYSCQEICTICEKLGKIFRYSMNIRRSEFVTLCEEIEHIQNYIYIQKIRFDDRFYVFYNIPDTILKCKVLRFILQPIVENAIYHGFEKKRGKGCLEIAASIVDDHLVIQVQDDGIGMTDQEVERLNAYINERENNILDEHKKSIGIRNVNSRIKLAHGDFYGITIKSRLNTGTQVLIKLPVYGYCKEDGYVQDSDCGR